MNSWTMFSSEEIKQQDTKKAHFKTTLETTKHGYLFRDAMSAFKSSCKKKDVKFAHFWLAELCISGEV